MTRSNTRRIQPNLLAAVQADLLCPLDDFEFISYFLLKAEYEEEERLDDDLSSSSESEQSWSSEREESAPVSDVSDVSTSDSEVDSAREAARKRRRTRVEVYGVTPSRRSTRHVASVDAVPALAPRPASGCG